MFKIIVVNRVSREIVASYCSHCPVKAKYLQIAILKLWKRKRNAPVIVSSVIPV